MTKTLGLSLLLIISVTLVKAQTDYALLANGDTLRGEIKFTLFENLDRLQLQAKGKKSNYTAVQIKGFQKDDFKYQSVKYLNSYKFMKVIKSGYLSLFEFNTTLSSTWDGLYLKKLDDAGREVPNIAFRKILSSYLSDCPSAQAKIESGELKKKDLNDIVDFYNLCKENNSPVAIAKKENEKVKSIKDLIIQIGGEDFLTKKDALDVLNEIQGKVSKNESIPNFLFESLKSYLLDKPELLKKAEETIALMKK